MNTIISPLYDILPDLNEILSQNLNGKSSVQSCQVCRLVLPVKSCSVYMVSNNLQGLKGYVICDLKLMTLLSVLNAVFKHMSTVIHIREHICSKQSF